VSPQRNQTDRFWSLTQSPNTYKKSFLLLPFTSIIRCAHVDSTWARLSEGHRRESGMAGKPPLEGSIFTSNFPLNQCFGTSKIMVSMWGMSYSRSSPWPLHSQLIYSKAQLEYKLSQWEFRQKMKKEAWNFVRHEISRRERAGKKSDIILSGVKLRPEVVRRETLRNRPLPKLGRAQPCKPLIRIIAIA
jgi:hypothetical protein